MGLCYKKGDGVGKDEIKALAWFLVAAVNSNEKASVNAQVLMRIMSNWDIDKAKQMAKEIQNEMTP